MQEKDDTLRKIVKRIGSRAQVGKLLGMSRQYLNLIVTGKQDLMKTEWTGETNFLERLFELYFEQTGIRINYRIVLKNRRKEYEAKRKQQESEK